MAILKKNGELQQQKFDFLLRGPKVMGMENPLKEWVLDSTWGSVQALKASNPCPHCTMSPSVALLYTKHLIQPFLLVFIYSILHIMSKQ